MIQATKKLNVPAHKQCVQIKLAILGDQQTGKSSFVSRYTNNVFHNNYNPTLGVETGNKYINQKNMLTHITLWDFSGNLDFLEIRNQFYKEIHAALIFGDLSAKNCLQSLDYWIKEVKESGATPSFLIVGTKSDIKKGVDLGKYAKDRGYIYSQISSKTGQGIQDLMSKILKQFK